jgi:hypothetical protein
MEVSKWNGLEASGMAWKQVERLGNKWNGLEASVSAWEQVFMVMSKRST